MISNGSILPATYYWENYPWLISPTITDKQGNPVSLISDSVYIKVYDYFGKTDFDVTTTPLSITRPSSSSTALHQSQSTPPFIITVIREQLIVRGLSGKALVELFSLQGRRLSSHRVIPASNDQKLIRVPASSGPLFVRITTDRGTNVRMLNHVQ